MRFACLASAMVSGDLFRYRSVALSSSTSHINCTGAESAQGAANRRRPLPPPGSGGKIATSWFPQLIPSGFGSGASLHPCKLHPQPTSLWADPAYGKRFGDLDATKNRAVFQLTAKNNTNVTETDESPLEIGEP
ncbi:hypothetical protein STW0522KLE44_25850 [Klebsiella sp. STW0522-44]|nr:hypothetical protein STW0522KLE44_25850 [Klebsiella sp. STW0522-44]